MYSGRSCGAKRAEEVAVPMPLATYPDVKPPFLFPAYDGTLLRAPLEPLIEAPADEMSQSPGPDFQRIPVSADGADLPLKQAQTRRYFPDEQRANAADPVLLLVPPHRRATLIARRDGCLRFGIRLQGPGETAFLAL